jgi:hypothetical protein
VDPTDLFLESPLSWQRIQDSLLSNDQKRSPSVVRIKSWMAFCFGLRMDWVKSHLLSDGSNRLWNGMLYDVWDFFFVAFVDCFFF